MPFRSPMPSTHVSMCVAPETSAMYAFAMAQPVSSCTWNSMSQPTAARTCSVRSSHNTESRVKEGLHAAVEIDYSIPMRVRACVRKYARAH
jgi:hypothetical protein